MHERLTNLRPVIFLQFAANTPRTEVWRGLHGASTLQSNCGKIVIAVSEDIDPTSMDAVLWSLAYRTNPAEDMHIVPHRGGVQGAQYGPGKTELRAAGRRDAQAADAAARAADARVHGARPRALGGAWSCRALNVQAPWHGYTLDDWTDTWETYAQRTVAGDWEQTGKETLLRQRNGLRCRKRRCGPAPTWKKTEADGFR